jgi:N-dimethylarginine dimethylaminohydrolase
MCPATYFDVRYTINPWMREGASPPVSHERAMRQWNALRRVLAERAIVHVLEPDAAQPDLCFTANAGFLYENVFVCSRFRHVERRGEERLFWNWFAARGYACVRLGGDTVFEGAGDALADGLGRIWMGHGQRSTIDAAALLRNALGVEVFPLRLVDPRFYHLDTCFAPLACGSVLYFPAAFDAASVELIERHYAPERRIAVDKYDAVRFACNAVDLGDAIVVNVISAMLRTRLQRHGVAVLDVELDEFLKSGGSAKCLVLPLKRPVRARPAPDVTVRPHAGGRAM